MIGSLRGQISSLHENTLVLDVNGVGYELSVTRGVLDICLHSGAFESGKSLQVTVYTDVKENSIELYGFANLLERQVFLLLKRVKGVGSRIALNVVSALSPEVLLSAIALGDTNALLSISGIGRKMAERVIVELREHVTNLLQTEVQFTSAVRVNSKSSEVKSRPRPAPKSELVPTIEGSLLSEGKMKMDVLLALEKLGFPRERADAALRGALELGVQISDSSELLRHSLVQLGQG